MQLRSQVFLLLWSISFSLIRMTACFRSSFAYSNSYLTDLISSTSLPFVSTRKALSKQKIARTLRSVIAISFWARSITFFIYSIAVPLRIRMAQLTDIIQILKFIKRVSKLSGIVFEFFFSFFEVLFRWHTLFQLLIFFIILYLSLNNYFKSASYLEQKEVFPSTGTLSLKICYLLWVQRSIVRLVFPALVTTSRMAVCSSLLAWWRSYFGPVAWYHRSLYSRNTAC